MNFRNKTILATGGMLVVTLVFLMPVVFNSQTIRQNAQTSGVSVEDNVTDEGQASFKITTSNATYFLQKSNGGLSSMLDRSGTDWINFHPTGGSAGHYRGIPNLLHPEGVFHPGFNVATVTLVSQDQSKVTFQVTSNDNATSGTWEFFPTHARLTITKVKHNYWFLYEGTPGGSYNSSSNFVLRSPGTKTSGGQSWNGDLPNPEWVMFGDASKSQGLFMVHHQDDNQVDSYYGMENNMTVFGFGRSGANKHMSSVPATFSIGFTDDTSNEGALRAVNNAISGSGVTQPTTGENVPTTAPTNQPAVPIHITPTVYCLGSCTVIPTQSQQSGGDQTGFELPPIPGPLGEEGSNLPQVPTVAPAGNSQNPIPTINALLSSVPVDTSNPQSPQLSGFINGLISQLKSVLTQASNLPTQLSNAVRQAITDLENLLSRNPSQNPNQNPVPTSPPNPNSNPTSRPNPQPTRVEGGGNFSGQPQKSWCRREQGGTHDSCRRFLRAIGLEGKIGSNYNTCKLSPGPAHTCCTLWPQDTACR